MATEEAEYTVLLEEEPFELRSYAPQVLAETLVDGDFEDAGNQAFGRLFRYISGNNKSRQEVAMTAPVGQQASGQEIAMTAPVGQRKEGGRWAVSFMMPSSFTLATAPEPRDPNVYLREVPARRVAAIRYGGFWSRSGYLRNKASLDAWIKEQGLAPVGEPVWARYDPPYMPWFLRRNEILVEVEPAAQPPK